METILNSVKKINGEVTVPGDKSMSHRSLIFGALASGETWVNGILNSADVQSTRLVLSLLGVEFQEVGKRLMVKGVGEFKKPRQALDCGNSGTTMRLMMGLLAACPFETTMIGDNSLSKRPMKRVADPLIKMGAKFEMTDGTYPPLKTFGGKLSGIDYSLPVASAQVKSAIILAGLFANGTTRLTGEIQSRDHTERMLRSFGVNLEVSENEILVTPQKLKGTEVFVAGDPSTAAFPMAAAALLAGSSVRVNGISLNETRTGFLQTLVDMGVDIETLLKTKLGEPIGDVIVRAKNLIGVEVPKSRIPAMIDEIPVLAVLATQARGTTLITGAEELRVKESDRIEAVAGNLRAMGAKVKTLPDGLEITGPQKLKGARIKTFHDHRIAMAFSIAALVAEGETTIEDSEVVGVSYPDFFHHLKILSQSSSGTT